jgi:hypothetical protein
MTDRAMILASVIRQPSPHAMCTCSHWPDCACGCHDRHCDPGADICHTDFLPDDGGFALWGCPRCTPGQEAPHVLGCELIGWNVPVPAARVLRRSDIERRPRFLA